MMLSHLLVKKGVDTSDYVLLDVVATQKIGKNSLKAQELYIWENNLWSKWEVYEKFEENLDAIWEANNTKEPAPPKGFRQRRSGTRRGDQSQLQMVMGGEASRSGVQDEQPTRVSDRELMESIQAQQQKLSDMHIQFVSDYDDYQWRQTALLQAMSGQMGLGDVFSGLFGGYPTTAPAPPVDLMDQDGDGGQED